MPRKKKAERPEPPSAFGGIFARYRSSIAALREFFIQLHPIVTEFDAERTEAENKEAQQLVESFAREASKEDTAELGKFIDLLQRDLRKPRKPGGPEKPLEITGRAAQLLLRLVHFSMRHQRSLTHYELLNRGILSCLVGSFEVLLSNLAHEHYRLHPGAVGNDEKGLRVNELRTFTSLDEAVEVLISRRVDELLRGDVSDWTRFFRRLRTANLPALVPSWAQWCEIYQRRHLIIHADGVVDRHYLDKVNWANVAWPKDKPTVGTRLPVEADYVALALDLFEAGGILLCQSVWKKLVADETPSRLSPTGGLIDAVYDQVLNGRWRVAEYVADWARNDESGNEEGRLIFAFNRWLAIKRQGRWSEIAEEIERFDCSAKNPRFALALASLRERPEEFFKPDLIAASGLGVDELREWPILEEMRADPRFSEVLARMEAQREEAGDGPSPPG
jgi:hypothetical protein